MSSKTKQQSAGRQNISTACTECRYSKLKCDGKSPRCGRCEARSKECVYQFKLDKRRIPLKKVLSVFIRRAQQLEVFIQQNCLELPEVPQGDREIFKTVQPGHKPSSALTADGAPGQNVDVSRPESNAGRNDANGPTMRDTMPGPSLEAESTLAGANIGDYDPLPRTATEPMANVAASTQQDCQNVLAFDTGNDSNAPELDWELFSNQIQDMSASMTTNCNFILPSGDSHPNPLLPNYPAGQNSNSLVSLNGEGDGNLTEDDELVKQLSNRMGRLHMTEDGQFRFYGATSNFNLARCQAKVNPKFDIPERPKSPSTQVDLIDEADPSLEAHFENLYFAWQDPCYHVIDRPMYEQGKGHWHDNQAVSTFYTPFLTNAICAFGALFHSPRHKAERYSRYYTKSAKRLLDDDLDSPKVATVQGLVVLSSVKAAATRDARGWLYSGMAMRLAFDLGLHVDMASCVMQADMTAEEAKARCTAFWGCYIVDHLWGFYLGRPFHTNGGNITVQKPRPNPCVTLEHPIWVPYGLGSSNLAPCLSDGMANDSDLILQQWVQLCESMDTLGNLTYGCSTVSEDDLILVADNTIAGLLRWKNSLPTGLQIDPDDTSISHVPHLLLLHMQYYQILIHVHRPLISKGPEPSDSSLGGRRQQSRVVCIDAAFAIAKLIKIYERHYNLRRINIQAVSVLFSAALMLMFATMSPTKSHDYSMLTEYLEVCSNALAEMGESFENAARSLDLLLVIKRAWQARLVSGGLPSSKRRRPSRPGVGVYETRNKVSRSNGGISAESDANSSSPEHRTIYEQFGFGPGPVESVDWRYIVGQCEGG